MAVKLFIVGLPGSGKSEVARNIDPYVREKVWPGTKDHWYTTRHNDYPVLDEMSKDKTEGAMFERLKPRGFNVREIVAFDIALQKLEPRLLDYLASAKKEEIILIEFARNDYWRAFRQFNKAFLQDAFFIYLGADIDVCKQRVDYRVKYPKHPDDYPISDYIFEKYYNRDDRQALSSVLLNVFGIDEWRILMHDNNGSLETALKSINPFVDFIIRYTMTHHDEAVAPSFPQATTSFVDRLELASKERSSSPEEERLKISG